MNSTGWVATIIILILVVIGAWWYTQQPAAVDVNINANQNATTTEETPATTATSTPTATTTTATPKTVTVTFSDTGFSPKSVTINKGDTVRFTSNTTRAMQVAADEHPTHTQYDGTTRTQHCTAGPSTTVFDQCTNGTSYSFTFNKTGTFNYHNHAAAQFGGTVTVQ